MSVVTETLRIRTHTGLHGRIGMRLIGPLDTAGANVLKEETARRAPGPGDHVVLHLEDVTVLEPAGVNAIAYVEAFVRARGCHVTIGSSTPAVTASLGLAGMERLLDRDTRAPASDRLPVGRTGSPQGS
jgi:anti-anti-sigma regulatory factor